MITTKIKTGNKTNKPKIQITELLEMDFNIFKEIKYKIDNIGR